MLARIFSIAIYIGLPSVAFYHHIHENTFLNLAATDASGLEKLGDTAFIPIHYLICGKEARPVYEKEFAYTIQQRFDYTDRFVGEKLCASVLAAPFSLIAGTLCKGVSFLSKDVRDRYEKINETLFSPRVESNIPYYQSIGIDFSDYSDLQVLKSKGHKRRPGEEQFLEHFKYGLAAILEVFKEEKIPAWVDCGTCLGAYRYGGVIPWDEDVDLAILKNDHQNAMRALRRLDPERFTVQDWSGRANPDSYIRVYIKAIHDHVDIYHFRIDEEKKTIKHVLSNEFSRYMPEWWKIRERRFCPETPFSEVFPLKRAQFDGVEVFVPNDTEKYLQARYGENIDPVKIYNEETGEYEKDLSHPYWDLIYVK